MNEELLKRLDVLAAKLGVTAQYLWGVLVKQARIEMWTDIGVCAFLVISGAAALAFAAWLWRKGQDEYGDWEAGSVLAGLLALILLACATAYGSAAITEGINPEYWALKQILQTVN